MTCWTHVCFGCGEMILPEEPAHVWQDQDYCDGCWWDFRDDIGWYVEQDVDIYFEE